MYGSNTAHYLRERSQRFLLATQGVAACWAVHWFIKISVFLTLFRGVLFLFIQPR